MHKQYKNNARTWLRTDWEQTCSVSLSRHNPHGSCHTTDIDYWTATTIADQKLKSLHNVSWSRVCVGSTTNSITCIFSIFPIESITNTLTDCIICTIALIFRISNEVHYVTPYQYSDQVPPSSIRTLIISHAQIHFELHIQDTMNAYLPFGFGIKCRLLVHSIQFMCSHFIVMCTGITTECIHNSTCVQAWKTFLKADTMDACDAKRGRIHHCCAIPRR